MRPASAALTFYTLLSIVPVFAVIFGVANFNAIYGSFAALPLFIVWVQTSWTLVLLGAELCFAFENADTYCCATGCPELTPGSANFSRCGSPAASLKILRPAASL